MDIPSTRSEEPQLSTTDLLADTETQPGQWNCRKQEAEGTERVTGFAVGGARGGGVDRHADVIDSDCTAGREVECSGVLQHL